MTEPNAPSRPSPPASDVISLAPIVDTIWSYRFFVAAGLAVTLAVFIAASTLLLLLLPTERIAAMSFRVDMVGADKGEYPNGSKFSPNDVIATPVLNQVYESNGLHEYMTFSAFASAFLVESWNLKRDALAREYEAKLTDARLSPVDRTRLEEEFQNKLQALRTPEYRLTFRRQDTAWQMPQHLLTKILEDTVATWARQADDRKGALRYDLPVLSGNILSWEAISTEDYLIGIDILRGKVVRILENIDDLAKLPGAETIRSGSAKLTLAEIRVSLEDLLRFKIVPLVGFVRANGLSKQPELLRTYVDSQLFQMKMKSDEASRRAAAVEQSLQQYALQKGGAPGGDAQNRGLAGLTQPQGGGETPAMIPQFGESFLDRLVELSSRSDDVGYRQKLTDRLVDERLDTARLGTELQYYEQLSQFFAGFRPTARTAAAPELQVRMKEAFDRAAWALEHSNALYEQLSKHNLNPATMLYTVTLPFTQRTVKLVTWRTLLLWAILVHLVAVVLLVIGSLGHHYLLRSSALARRAESRADVAS